MKKLSIALIVLLLSVMFVACDLEEEPQQPNVETLSEEVTAEDTASEDTVNKPEEDKTECTEHEFGEWQTTKAATCTEKGEMTRVRKICTYSETGELKANGHNYTEHVTPLTADEQGYTTHIYTVCNDNYIDSYVPATGPQKLAYEINSDGKICTIVGSETCKATDIVIPAEIDGYTVTAVGENAFKYDIITSVVIPDTAVSIGDDEFNGCGVLASVTIPDSVLSIGEWAFSGGSELESVVIPEGVTIIDSYAFYICESLTSVTIPKSVSFIGDYVFRYMG